MVMTQSLFSIWALRLAVGTVFLPGAAMAQADGLTGKVKHFEDTLRAGLVDKSRKDLAQRMQRWTAFLSEQTDRISVDGSEPGAADQHVQNALMAARAINRGMISHGFSGLAQKE